MLLLLREPPMTRRLLPDDPADQLGDVDVIVGPQRAHVALTDRSTSR